MLHSPPNPFSLHCSPGILAASLWLSFAFIWYSPAVRAQQLPITPSIQQQGTYNMPSSSAITQAIEVALLKPEQLGQGRLLLQLNNRKDRDSENYWINTLQASGGSAAGNATLIAAFIALDILPSFLMPGSDWITGNGPLLSLLVLIPAITTPLFMHLWSPEAQAEHILGSGIASLLSTLIHLGLMVGLGFAFNEQGWSSGLASTFYLLAPIGFLSAVLVESMSTAQGHHVAKSAASQQGSIWEKGTQRAQLTEPWMSTRIPF